MLPYAPVIDRFHWVIPSKLAGMSLPGRAAILADDLAEAHAKGIRAIATLTEDPLPSGALTSAGLASRHFPIVDFDIPTIVQTADFCRWVDEQISEGRPVAAHCFAGLGRTGTMLACWLVRERGATTEVVLRTIRRIEPGFVQTAQQEAFVAVWESKIKSAE